MLQLTDAQKAEFFKRSYMAVDGLWFVKCEDRLGFDSALELDVDVWKVMPKIQARKLKAMTNAPETLDGLFDCYTTKLALEGFVFQTSRTDDAFEITASECPWYVIMKNAGRAHLAEKIGPAICTTEYGTWATEFGKDIRFEMINRFCTGDSCCRMRFWRTGHTATQADKHE